MKTKYEELRLREEGIFPTDEVLKKALGDSYPAYQTFQKGLAELDLSNEWKFYPCVGTKAWMARGEYKWTTVRGANKTKNIYWLSVWDGYFHVAVWFKEMNRAEILKADISEETKQLIRGAKIFGPKMKTFPIEFQVKTTNQIQDIYTLIRYKKKLEA